MRRQSETTRKASANLRKPLRIMAKLYITAACGFAYAVVLTVGEPAKSAEPAKTNKATKLTGKVSEQVASKIKSAQELVLQQKRTKAAEVLVGEIEKQTKITPSLLELKKQLSLLSEIFFTEKAQKGYESGRALVFAQTDQSIEKLNEVLTLEPDNVRIMKELTKALLLKGECGKSLASAKAALSINPYDPSLVLLRIQSKACSGGFEDLDAELANPFVDLSDLGYYIDTIKAQKNLKEGRFAQALDVLLASKGMEQKYPETYYWMAQARVKLNQSPLEEYEGYLDICKKLGPTATKKFEWEPRTCKEMATVEQSVQQLKAETGT